MKKLKMKTLMWQGAIALASSVPFIAIACGESSPATTTPATPDNVSFLPTKATDAVTTRTAKTMIDPTQNAKNIDISTITTIQNDLFEGARFESQVEITLIPSATTPNQPAQATNNVVVNLPTTLYFSGNNNATNVRFSPLQASAEVKAKYALKLFRKTAAGIFKIADDATAASLANVDLTLANNDEVLLVVIDIASNNVIQTNNYKVWTLNETAPAVKINPSDISAKLANKAATLEEVFAYMDAMKPGLAYTSGAAQSGNFKTLIIPDSTALQQIVKTPNPRAKSDRLFAPWVYLPSAANSLGNLNALYKYQALNLGFIQGMQVNGLGYLAWGGEEVMSNFNGAISDRSKQQLETIEDLHKNGVDTTISFGGAAGTSIFKFRDPVILAKALEEFVKGTRSTRIDFDIEGAEAKDIKGIQSVAVATALLQQKMLAEGSSLEVSLTLSADYTGLVKDGLDIFSAFVKQGVSLRHMDAMTMMLSRQWTDTWKADLTPGQKQAIAIPALKKQIQDVYAAANHTLTDEQAAKLLGITINIGTDTWETEIIKPEEVAELYNVMVENKLGMFSFWNVQAYEKDIKYEVSYMGGIAVDNDATAGWDEKDRMSFFNAMSKLPEAASWKGYDEKWHGTNALTNAAARAKALEDLATIYASALGPEQTKIISYEEAQKPITLYSGDLFLWLNPDGRTHLWKTNWWTGGDQRPGSATLTGGQITDLGAYPSAGWRDNLTKAQNSFANEALGNNLTYIDAASWVNYQYILGVAPAGPTAVAAFANNTPYKTLDLVLSDGKLYVANADFTATEAPSEATLAWRQLDTSTTA